MASSGPFWVIKKENWLELKKFACADAAPGAHFQKLHVGKDFFLLNLGLLNFSSLGWAVFKEIFFLFKKCPAVT